MVKKKTISIIIYTIFFYALWTLFEFKGKELLNSSISNEILLQIIKSGIIKNLFWTLPSVLLVLHFKSEIYITLQEMFTTKVNWLKYLYIFIIFTIYILIGSIIQNGKLEITGDFGINKIIIVIFVGLTEEMVFRGWLLNAAISGNNKWIHIIINSVMFLAIHFPNWIHEGIFISNFTNFGFLSPIVLSIIFSWTFIKSRNILVPILLHMYWDLLMFMFI